MRTLMPQESQAVILFSSTGGKAVLEASTVHPKFLQDCSGEKDSE